MFSSLYESFARGKAHSAAFHPNLNNFELLGLTLCALFTWGILRYLYQRSAPSLWNVAGPRSPSWLLGNIPQLISADGYKFHKDLAENYGRVVKLHSILGSKQLYVFDPLAMHTIFIKNEAIWNMPEFMLSANHLMFGPCLVSTSGSRHRRARKIMNPVFSPSRLREILPILFQVAHTFMCPRVLEESARREVDMLSVLGATSLEFIGQAGLGHSFAASDKDTEDNMKQLLFAAKRMIVPMQLLPTLMKTLTASVRRYLIDYIPLPDLHLARDLTDLLEAGSRKILERKRQALKAGDITAMEEVGEGKDILSSLLKATERVNGEDGLPEEELLGQMNVIIFAASDTTSSAMSRCLQELAQHRETQSELREEVCKAFVHGDLDYENLLALPLLDAVIRETLRMYPPATTATREALQDTILPLETPLVGVDGKLINELFIPKGTVAQIGLKAANQDSRIWGPDSTEWKPSRWLGPLPNAVMDAKIPGVFPKLMTFIGGARGCIGFKFAEMSLKVQLSVLVQNFDFSLSDKEIQWKLGVAEAPEAGGKQSLPLLVAKV